jgi:hypothetical protein
MTTSLVTSWFLFETEKINSTVQYFSTKHKYIKKSVHHFCCRKVLIKVNKGRRY